MRRRAALSRSSRTSAAPDSIRGLSDARNAMSAFVSNLASRPHGAIYIGATTNLRQRVTRRRLGAVDAHTRKYRIRGLVYFETHDTLEHALARQRKLKRWRRAWKDALIAEANPMWRDVAGEIPL